MAMKRRKYLESYRNGGENGNKSISKALAANVQHLCIKLACGWRHGWQWLWQMRGWHAVGVINENESENVISRNQ